MLIAATLLLLLAAIVLIVGLRGRASVRGVYCKRCRFDLGGVNRDHEDARCPECGSSVHDQSSRLDRVRHRRPALIWLGVVLSLLGGGLLGVGVYGGASSIYIYLPTNSLLTLVEWGDAEGLDEVVRRIGTPSESLTERQWDRLIEHGLAIQADESIEWDWRWGEILSVALVDNRMSEEEIGRYFLNGLSPELTVRTTAHPGTPGIPNRLDITQNRMWAINYKPTNFVVTCHLIAFGEVGREPIQHGPVREYPRAFNISASPNQRTGASFGGDRGINHRISRAAGETACVYFDYVVRVRRMQGEEPIVHKIVREEFEIEFVDPGTPLIKTVRDDAAARVIFENMRCSAIEVPAEFPGTNQFGMYSVLMGYIYAPRVTHQIALRLFIELDGEELEVGKLQGLPSMPSDGYGGSMWARTSKGEGPEHEHLRLLHERLLQTDHVRIIARSAPDLAAGEPDGDEILGVEIVFENVPIAIKQIIPAYYSEITEDMRQNQPASYVSYGPDRLPGVEAGGTERGSDEEP